MLGLMSRASGADGVWTGPAGGNWSDPSKWSGSIVADGSGFTANFANNPTSDTVVQLDGPRTISQLVFGDSDPASPASWTLENAGNAANLLTLAGTTPGIVVNALGTGKSATLSTAIAGNSGLAKSGAGLLALAAANTFSGTTSVAGPLELRHLSALASSTALAFSNSSTLQLRSDLAGTFATPAAALAAGATVTLDVGPRTSGTNQTLTFGGALQLTHNATTTGTVNVTGSAGYSLAIPTVNISNTAASNSQVRLAFKPTTANLTLGAVNGITTGGGRDPYLILDGTSTGNRVTGKIANPVSGAAWTYVTKQGTGTWTLTGPSNNFAGTCSITAGILNVQVNSALGNTNRGTTVSSGATLQLQSATSLNYSSAEALTLNGNGVANQGALQNIAGTNTFAGLLTLAGNTRIQSDTGLLTLSHAGTITGPGFDLTAGGAGDIRINGILGTTTGDLVKTGSGTLTLAGANTFTGTTGIQAGTLALTATGSISNSTRLDLATSAVFDISAIPAYAWPTATPLHAAGGDLKGGTTIDLGSTPLVLDFTPASLTGDLSRPALTLSSGTLAHAGPLTVVNQAPSPLGIGRYRLISQASGPFTATPDFDGIVGGQGIAAGTFCYLQPIGDHLDLVVSGPIPTTTVLTRDSGIAATTTYGDTLRFFVQVTPPPNGGSVELLDGANVIAASPLTAGSALITLPDTALAANPHPQLTARFPGTAWHLTSTSAALSQAVSPKPLTLTGPAALDKYYDTSTAATITGTLSGVEVGDTVSFTPTGTFASPAVGSNIAVTSTATLTGSSSANYTLVPPTGLAADIVAAHVWTGGAGGTGTSLATGANYSPAATPTSPFTAIFNGLDPATTDLSLASAIGGAVGTSGMVFGFAGNQTNPVVVTGTTGATVRISSVAVAPGAGPVTFQGTIPFVLGGPSADTNHSFVNDSSNPLVFQNIGNWVPGGSGNFLRFLFFGGSGDITVATAIVPAVPSRISLSKSGTGSLVLSGANTFSGGTTIQDGAITAQSATALGSGPVVNHGTLDLTAGAVAYSGLSNRLSGGGTVNVTLGTGTATTVLNGNHSDFTGTWNLGTAAAPAAGKVQMNGADHPSATIRVLENATLYTTTGTHRAALVLHGGNTGESLGQLRIEGSAIWEGPVTLAGDITGPGDGHLGASSGTGTVRGNIGETGGPRSLVKEGDGTIVLTGTNTFTGTTAVNDGILLVDSPGSLAGAATVASGATFGGSGTVSGGITIDAGGTLDPGRAGPVTLTVHGPLALAGTTLFRVNRSAYPLCGRIQSSAPLALGGALRVVNQGPALKLGDRLQLFTAPSFTGSFASILLPPLGYDLMWDSSDLAIDGSITVASAASLDHPVVTLTPGTFHQQILGIGGNFCQGEQSALVGYNRYDEMFGPDGLNMSFIRLSTAHELAEPGFANFDANNVTTVQQFRARQPNGRVMLTTWTPPESLKSTNSPYQGTLAKTAGGHYRYTDYAAWWTRALQFYQTNAALPDYVSIQNECDFTPTPPASGPIAAYLAGCYLNATETSTKAGYPQALAAVRSAFAGAGLGSMKMIGPDTTAIAGDKVKNYLDNIPSGQIDAIAHHLYHDSPGSTGITNLARLQTHYPYWVIPKFMTELNPHDTYEEWDPAQPGWMQLAVTMHNVFTHERANTYMVWSSMYGFIDRFTGVPNNANYYALAHFSRFVNAKNWCVAAASNDPELLVTHYRHYGGPGISDRQIVVLINKSAEPKHTTLGTAASWSANPAQRAWQVHQTANDGSATKRITMTELDQGPWVSGNRQLVLPPHSLTTVLINTGTAASEFTHQQVWRFQHFGTMDNTGIAADSADSNNDGESNLYEFATGQNPYDATRVSPTAMRNGGQLEFIYTRSKAAVLDGATFTVEWSDTLAADSWGTAGISSAMVGETARLETIKATLPAGSAGKRFVHLVISAP